VINNNIVTLRKPADTDHPIHNLISERWSTRAFAEQPVAREQLHSLFEAARWAASTSNQQPWNFLFATKENSAEFARFSSLLFEGNLIWAQNAPVLVIIVAKLYEYPGKETLSFFDTGLATANLMTQAVALGLATHPMGGFDADKARTELNIPENYVPLAMIALGYPGIPDQLPANLYERERAQRSRNPLKDFIFEGSWQQPAPDAGL